MFEPTIPFGEPELMRVSAFQRYLGEAVKPGTGTLTVSRLSSLSPSLTEDLQRFEQGGGTTEALEVLAACVRHSQRVTVHLQCADKVVPLTVFPQERLVHSPLDTQALLSTRLTELSVLHVEPAVLRPPGDPETELIGESRLHQPLGPLLWELALRGTRAELLPEIAGPAAYRVSPGLDLTGLRVNGSLMAAVERLQRSSTSLRSLSDWPGVDRDRAARLLNALYLQAGLIVSRTHPDALGDSWFGALGR
ncbi:hypothetical protein BH09PSE5_BH09PSE5_39080 [soil metagenome]